MPFLRLTSISRYLAKDISRAEIALNLFLDNPMFFYGHHNLFREGIDGFNGVANIINSIEPGVEWKSLDYIVQHFYLQRKVDDSEYEIQAFSSNFVIKNTTQFQYSDIYGSSG